MAVTLFGVSAITLIIGIVQLLKVKANMPVGLAPWVALFLSLAVSTVAYMVRVYPETAGLLEAVVGAVVLWLTVSGAYEKGKDAGVPGLGR